MYCFLHFYLKNFHQLQSGILYFVYSMINGVTLSVVFVVYELSSIVSVFIISALVFGILGFIGYKTNRDLNSWGTYIIVFLIAGIVLSLLNLIVFRSSVLDIAIDWLILILFCGATIYDINKIKVLQESADINQDKIHIYCAMQLYLDFINIFLRILSLFGKSKD
ncbi:MAG: Bax inhibitor-1/YccA family protein [Clostridia bacterium]